MQCSKDYNDIDEPEQWRKAEFFKLNADLRTRLGTDAWPTRLSFRGDDWFAVQVEIDGRPVGPKLAWPNALFVGAWLTGPGGMLGD